MKQTLGVLGGGQLARMLVQAAQRMGYRTVVLDPTPASPAGQISHQQIVAAYDDPKGWQQLCEACDAITTEFENVPAAALEYLSAHKPTSPPAPAVAIAQDRLLEKQHFDRCSVRCAPYRALHNLADVQALPASLFPAIIKTARLGYDGKGQVSVVDVEQAQTAWQQLGGVPCVIEQKLALALECSVIVARNAQGHTVHFAPQRNDHHNGILATTYAFANAVPQHLADELVQATTRIAKGLDYVGVLCVEYFVLQDGTWVVNEMAPRPHNSGHYTIDACDHSQFDLQARTTLQLPLVPPRQHSAAIMLNLLGDVWLDASDKLRTPRWQQVQALPGVHLHLYGKHDVKPGRKMGHITLTAATAHEVQDKAAQVAALLDLPFEAI
ncbi:MAG: 5-(carboxyamino)imidazole ribonucleotide synthase [Brachymonas sp.]|nr:5-(carboxyamino)imidazole ribonucleotide synthase [Brachymonas sp.]